MNSTSVYGVYATDIFDNEILLGVYEEEADAQAWAKGLDATTLPEVRPLTLYTRSSFYSKPEPGVMHEVDAAFYNLTVQQRDAAWAEIERLKSSTVSQGVYDVMVGFYNEAVEQCNAARAEVYRLRDACMDVAAFLSGEAKQFSIESEDGWEDDGAIEYRAQADKLWAALKGESK